MRFVTMVAASAAVAGFWASAHTARAEAASVRGGPFAEAARQEDFRWSGRIARGRQIEINGLFGDVRAEASAGDQVEVVGHRRGAGAGDVRIVVDENDEGVTICTVYPGGEPRDEGGARGECDGNRHSGRRVQLDDAARIDWVVRVPEGVKFSAGTIDGDIIAEGMRGPVAAASVSGDVRLSTTGTARAATVSGDVTASFGDVDDQEMEFASVSGNVLLRLASGVNASVQAQTLSGEIESDFALRRGSMTDEDDDDDEDSRTGGMNINVRIGRQARGDVGRGGRELNVTTVSGDIRLERAR